jgi:transposase
MPVGDSWVREADECVPSSAHKDTVTVMPAFVQLPMPQPVQAALPPASAQHRKQNPEV